MTSVVSNNSDAFHLYTYTYKPQPHYELPKCNYEANDSSAPLGSIRTRTAASESYHSLTLAVLTETIHSAPSIRPDLVPTVDDSSLALAAARRWTLLSVYCRWRATVWTPAGVGPTFTNLQMRVRVSSRSALVGDAVARVHNGTAGVKISWRNCALDALSVFVKCRFNGWSARKPGLFKVSPSMFFFRPSHHHMC